MTSRKNVIKKLWDLEDDLEAEIVENDSDLVRAALVNIRGALSHLRSTLEAEESMVR